MGHMRPDPRFKRFFEVGLAPLRRIAGNALVCGDGAGARLGYARAKSRASLAFGWHRCRFCNSHAPYSSVVGSFCSDRDVDLSARDGTSFTHTAVLMVCCACGASAQPVPWLAGHSRHPPTPLRGRAFSPAFRRKSDHTLSGFTYAILRSAPSRSPRCATQRGAGSFANLPIQRFRQSYHRCRNQSRR